MLKSINYPKTCDNMQREVAAQSLRLVPDAVNAVVCAPDDG
jgi:hypothetical protein